MPGSVFPETIWSKNGKKGVRMEAWWIHKYEIYLIKYHFIYNYIIKLIRFRIF